ncbi:hypothetical protein QAD02_021152 [Eretmocerus hayati]|uniref:Uncharacterized protein n=1 Tax=Eretmocerus hayati TaxID=131215 RepID=A0ACC2PP37_9HYME|nr:hypothetical protein QAD02_021152 [Eretmocerus hayati]
MWCLIRVLPFLVCGKVPEDDEYLQMVLLLLEIIEIKFASSVPVNHLSLLDELYKDFLSMFSRLFPDVAPINKMHHGSHGPECIEWGDVKINRVEVISGKKMFMCHTKSRQYLLDLGLSDDEQVMTAKSVEVNGIEYRVKAFIALSQSGDRFENLMTFGEIREIIVLENRVFFLSSICTTVHFDHSVHAYCVELNDLDHSATFTDASSLPFHKPFCYWLKPTSNALHISLRHLIF